MTFLLLTFSVFVFYLIYERIVLDRLRKSIPLVITVTGTRGKSTVVRLLASVLRESGKVVLAKSTGSHAQYVMPDGTVEDVRRRGTVSILEQKQVLRRAATLKADCLVVEIMSIHPENHIVESQRILKPSIVLLTNVRRDHTEAMGEREQDIARVLQLDMPDGADVFLAEDTLRYFDTEELRTRSIRVNVVQAGVPLSSEFPKEEFSENLDLVVAVSKALNIDDRVIALGIRHVTQDVGKLKIWSLQVGGKRIFLVNGFAANDPESTMKVLDKTRELMGGGRYAFTGLLNLRRDRADRTLQWIDALNAGIADHFENVYALGGHAIVVKRRTGRATMVASDNPEEITRTIASEMERDGVLFGFGNIGGRGRLLVEYWQREGELYGV